MADGLVLRVVSTTGGPVHKLGVALAYPDYLAWCGGRLVYIAGKDRVAIHAKRLLAAAPPDWRPAPLWDDRSRSFASPACGARRQERRGALAALERGCELFRDRAGSSGASVSTAHGAELDAPPPGWADEAPRWSRDGRSLLFVRERKGYGRVMLLHDGRMFGPIANLGFAIGYYGHHDWQLGWSVGV